jgi:hypothetical protein
MSEDFTYEPEQGLAKVAQFTPRDVIPVQDPISLRDTTFAKIATKPVSKTAAKILTSPVDPVKEVDVLPTGECYMAQVHVRRRLNAAFSPMGWALRPLTMETPNTEINQMYQRFALVANGRVVAVAVGSAKYFPRSKDGKYANPRMDYADVAESIKSNALTRCCKDLGIGSELWDRRFATDWRNKHCVHVWVAVRDKKNPTKTESKDQWRRIDSEPFEGEIEPVKDSPNQPAWRSQMEAWIAMMKDEHTKTRAMKDRIDAEKTAHRQARAAQPQATPQNTEPTGGESNASRNVDAVAEEIKQPEDPKPAGNQAGAQKPTEHATNGIKADDRAFMVRECRPHVKGPKNRDGEYTFVLYRIVFMDGAEWFTLSRSVFASMQKHFAARDKIRVTQHETKEAGGKRYRMVVEWQKV